MDVFSQNVALTLLVLQFLACLQSALLGATALTHVLPERPQNSSSTRQTTSEARFPSADEIDWSARPVAIAHLDHFKSAEHFLAIFIFN